MSNIPILIFFNCLFGDIRFNIPYNTFQVISVLSHWNIADTVVWYPAQSHYSCKRSTRFCIELPFICPAFDKGASTTNLKSLVWLPGPPRHRANDLLQSYCAGHVPVVMSNIPILICLRPSKVSHSYTSSEIHTVSYFLHRSPTILSSSALNTWINYKYIVHQFTLKSISVSL